MMKKSYLLLLGILFLAGNLLHAQRYEWMKIYSSAAFGSTSASTKVFGNNVYVAGEFQGSVSFGSTVLSSGTSFRSIYVANYDTLGNFRWAIKGGSDTDYDDFVDMELDQFGNIYIVGQFTNTTNWSPLVLNKSNSSSTNGREAFIVKLNSQGVAQWIRGIYSPGNFFPSNGVADISVIENSLYLTGSLTRTLAVTNTTSSLIQPISPFQSNIYVARWDLSGDLKLLSKVAVATVTSSSSASVGTIFGLTDSTYLISSVLRNVYSLGSNNLLTTANSTGLSDQYIISYTNSACDWFKSASGGVSSSISAAAQIEVGNNNEIYLAGVFRNTLQFQGQSITAPAFDYHWYIAKMDSIGTLIYLKDYAVIGFSTPRIKYTANDELVLVGSFRDSLEFNNKKTFTNGNQDIIVANLDTALNLNWYQTGGGGNVEYGIGISSDIGPNIYVLGSYTGLAQFGSTFFTGLNTTSTSILFKMSECGSSPIPFIFNGDTNLCQGQTVRIQANPAAASTFQWLRNSTQLTGEVYRDVVANSTGNYQVIVNGAGCVDTSRSVRVEVGTPPIVTFTLRDTACQFETPFPLSGGLPAGGIYKGAGITNGVFNPSIAGIGNKTINYVYSNGGCKDSASVVIFVKPAPTVFFAPLSNICITAPSFALTNAFPNGGVFSGNGVSGGIFDPAAAGGGSHVITYTYADGNGCSSSTTRTIKVDTIQTANLAALPTFCINDGVYTLTEGSPASGVYQGTGIVNGVFNPAISGVGTFQVRYIYTNQCGKDTAIGTITVNPTPTVTLGSFAAICEGGSMITLSGGLPIGGTYSGSGVNNGQFNPTTAGTFKIYYDYTDGIGCSSRDSSNLTVHSLPTVSLTNDTTICAGNSITLTATGGSTYTWSNSATTASITVSPTITTKYYVTVSNANSCQQLDSVTVTVVPNPSANISGIALICEGSSTTLTASGGVSYAWSNATNTATNTVSPTSSTTYTVTVTNSNGCTATASQLVTVNPTPTVTLGSFASVCEGSSMITLSGGLPTGGTYSGTGVNNGQFNPTTAGTFKIYYDYTDGIGCTSRDSSNLTVNLLPTVSLTNDTAICAGNSITLIASGGSTYVWNNSATTASITVSPTITTKYYVTVSNSNACQQRDSVTVTVAPNPTASISGTALICEGSSTTLTASGGVSYAWSNAINTASNTVSPITSTTYTVTVTNSSGCTATASQLVTVNPTPTVTLGSFAAVCEGSSMITLSGGLPTGGTYSGTGVNNGQFNPTTAGTFKIYYDYTDGIGCTSRDSSNLTVNSLPTVSLTNDTTICAGNSITLIATGGSTYVWNNSATTASITVSPTITTKYYVTVSNSNACQQRDSVTVTVAPNPTASISGTALICEGSSTTLTASGGVSYAWSNATSTATNTVSPITSTTYTVTVTNSNGCTATASQLVTVNPTPTVTLGSFAAVCEGSSMITLSGGLPTGGTYSGAGVSNGQFNPTTAGTFKIYYDYTDGFGCFSRDSSNLTVNSLPTVSLTNDTTICAGNSITLTASGGSTYAWSNSATTASITVSPTITTKYYVTVSNSSACQQIDSVTVSVVQKPVLTVSNDTSICLGETIAISANSSFSNYLWNTNATSSTILVSPSNTQWYIVRSFNGASCFAIDSILVSVNTGTPLSIGPDITLDLLNVTNYTYDAGVGYSSYLWFDNTTNQTKTINYDPLKAGTTDTITVIANNTVGCPSVDTALVFYDVNTSILSNENSGFDWAIYPNPTTGLVNLQFSNGFNSTKQIDVFDLNGKLIYSAQLSMNQNSTQLNLAEEKMERGIYTIRVTTDKKVLVKKVVLN